MMSSDVCRPLISYEAPRAIASYLHNHEFKKTFEFVKSKMQSDDSRRLLRHLIDENTVSELLYRQAYHTHRRRYIERARAYMQKNQLDALLYPTMPILPCKIDDYKEATKWKVEHNGRLVPWLSKSM